MLPNFVNVCDVVWATNVIGCGLWASMNTMHDQLHCDYRFHVFHYGTDEVRLPFPSRTTIYEMKTLDPEHMYEENLGKFILPVVLPLNITTILFMGTNTMAHSTIFPEFFQNVSTIAVGCAGDCFLANLTEWRSDALSERFAKRIVQRGYYIAKVEFDARAVKDPRLDKKIVRSPRGASWASDAALRRVKALPWDLRVARSDCFYTHDKGNLKLSSATFGIIVGVMSFAMLSLSVLIGVGMVVTFAFQTGRCKYSPLPDEEPAEPAEKRDDAQSGILADLHE